MATRRKPGIQEQLRETQAALAREKAKSRRLAQQAREARDQQAATADVLRAISASSYDTQPVFEVIAERSVALCGAQDGMVLRCDGTLVRLAAQHNLKPKAGVAARAAFPCTLEASGAGVQAIRTGQVVEIADLREVPDYQLAGAVEAGSVRRVLAVPLMHGGLPIGAVVVAHAQPGRFAPHQVAMVRTFADQAVIAIQNVRLFNETKQALERQTATAEILKVISSSPTDVQPVFEAIARNALILCGSSFANVFRYDGNLMHYAASHQVAPEQVERVKGRFPAPPDKGRVAGRAILSKAVVCIEDALSDPDYDRPVAASGGWRRMFAAPMLREGEPLGAIAVGWTEPGPIPKVQEELLKTFADQAVIAIENVRLFNETKEALEHQTATAEVLQVISNSVADTTPVFDKILSSCRRLFGDGFVTLGLVGDDGLVHIHQERDMFDHPDERVRRATEAVRAAHPRPARQSIYGYVAYKRQAFHFPDVLNGPGVPDGLRRSVELVGGNYSAIYAPMTWEGRGVGTLNVGRVPPMPFSEKEIRLLKTFADQAVIAIQNARLFNETKEALERQTATAEILKVIADSPVDIQPVFHAIAKSAHRLFDRKVAFQIAREGALHLGAAAGFTEEELAEAAALYPMPLEQTRGLRAMLEGQLLETIDAKVPGTPATIVAIARAGGFRSLVTVPLLREGELLGVLSLTAGEVKPKLDDNQRGLLKTFADQAVIAIENVRLFNETKEALERQTATAEILKVISSSPTDTKPVFDAIASSGVRLFGGLNVALVLARGEQIDLAAFATPDEIVRGEFPDSFPLPISEESVSGRAILLGEVVHVPDLESDPRLGERAKSVGRRLGYRNVLCAPLLRDGKAIGAIAVVRGESGGYSDKQIALLKTFADQAVIAIENVRLFKELGSRNAELSEALEQQTAMGEVLRAISQSPSDLRPILETLVRAASRFCGAPDVVLTRLDGDVLRGGAAVGSFAEILIERAGGIEAVAIPVNRGSVTGRAVVDRRVVHVEDLAAVPEPEFPVGRELQRRYGHHTMVSVPLLREGVPLGALALIRREVRPFSENQLALLKTFADQAVIAIENVRLFNETKEALERQTATAEILKVISGSPTDTRPVFDAIAASALRLFSGQGVGILLADGNSLQLGAACGSIDLDTARKRYPLPLNRETLSGRAILERAYMDIADTEAPDTPALLRDLARELGYRAIASAPMMRERMAIGSITVVRGSPGPLAEKEAALLRTFADQAVIAIENVRLFNETKEALERQTATAEILKVIASSPSDVQPVFDAIAANARRLLGGRQAVVGRRVGNTLHLAAMTSTTESGDAALRKLFPTPLTGQGVMGKAILSRESVSIMDVETDPGYSESFKEGARARGFRSTLSVPMLREGEAVGAINVHRPEPGSFTEHQTNLLKAFADQAVIAIENVRLFNETKEALERQTATAAVLRVISASPSDVGPVFAEILDHATQLCDAQLGFVFTTDGSAFEPVAQRGLDAEQYAAWCAAFQVNRVARPMSGLGRVLVTCAPVHIADVADDEAYRTRDPMRVLTVERLGARTFLAVPLLKEGAVIGAVVIYRREVRPFSDKQITLLKTFADQAVIAIENVRLFKELQSRTEALSKSVQRLTALGEVGRAISSTLDLDEVLKAIVSRAVQLGGLDAGVIYEYDQQNDAFLLRASESFDESAVSGFRGATIRRGEGAVGRCVEAREPVQVPDTHDPDYPAHLRELLDRSGFRALLAVPLEREEHVIGALMVIRRSPGAFAAEIVELLKTFAGQSALAVQNARLFREIAEKSHQLEEASKHKSQFLASMSHELRTPLNAILGFNEMILGEIYGEVPADMKGPLEDIQTSGKHLLRLINNVLDLAKIEAGRMELALADYSVQDTVESVRATLRPLAAEKGLEFLAGVPNDMPLAYGDSGRITQCLMNLAGNSLKFTKAGKVEISVALSDGMLRYCVADTGVGIPPEKIGSLFTEFKQTDATIASEYGGTGLGLSISRKFVEMHGGRIWVESEPGRGSSFIFEVPLRVNRGVQT